MIGDYKIVDYMKYCPKCVLANEPETNDKCSECLDNPARIDSHKPINFVEKREEKHVQRNNA